MIDLKTTFSAALALGLAACATETGYEPEHFEADAAIEMLQALSADEMKGRKVGTPENAKAREMIIDRFEELGILPDGPGFERPFTYGGFADPETGETTAPTKRGVNVLGYLPGSESQDISMIITAHYDHVGVIDGEIHNGADDNASGVVGLLAAAEYFSKNPPKHDVAFVAFDAEEDRLGGSIAFVADPPAPLDTIAMNINFDMLARGDNGLLWASGTHHWPGLVAYVDEVAATAPVEIKRGFDQGDGREDWTMLSDHAAFFRVGIPHLYFGVEDHPDYHKPSDDFEKVDQEWFLKSIDSVVAIAITMDEKLGDIQAMREASAAE
ncbi:MAG: M20/M25/M40 family metallo-hydrolase [Henriciella sp.]